MLLSLLLGACTTADSSWSTDQLFGPTGSSAQPLASAEPTVSDPRFPSADDLAALEDPWKLEEPAGLAEQPVVEDAALVAEAVVEEVVETVEPAVVAAPPAVGLPSEPVWGVRLLSTLPQAVPPRAALGLPSGEEVVVAPGSMLPEVGMVVIAVGDDTAQLAKVTPSGDHAVVETTTLSAQYPHSSEE